jgi:superfamily I DNA/RNA helicase
MDDIKEAQDLYDSGKWWDLAKLAYCLVEDIWESRFSSDAYQLKEARDKAHGLIDWVYSAEFDHKTHPLELLKTHEDRSSKLKNTKSKEGVRLLTVHASKGLEWDHVGLWNVGPSTFPLGHGEPKEERRLCYVGVTRARNELAIFVNPSATDTTVDYLTGETAGSNWGNHPILQYVGDDARELMLALQGVSTPV